MWKGGNSMSQRRTTVAERNHFIDLKLAGHTLKEVAEETGWSFECVRYWWRCCRDGGRKALDPPDGRGQRGGPMSTFPEEVRFSFLRIKKEHPGWGAAVARPRVAERLSLPEDELPSISTIERYWAKFPDRLYQHHHKRQPSKESKGPKPKEPHERWQADFKEKVRVEGIGRVDVFNIRDDATPVKIGSFVYARYKRHYAKPSPVGSCVIASRPTGRSAWSIAEITLSQAASPFGWPAWGSLTNSPVLPRRTAVLSASIEPGIVGWSRGAVSKVWIISSR